MGDNICKISRLTINRKEKRQNSIMQSLKQQKMGSIVGREEKSSSYESNFIIQQKFGEFSPTNSKSKTDMKASQDNRDILSSLISKSYVQP